MPLDKERMREYMRERRRRKVEKGPITLTERVLYLELKLDEIEDFLVRATSPAEGADADNG